MWVEVDYLKNTVKQEQFSVANFRESRIAELFASGYFRESMPYFKASLSHGS
jgi:hypothetical protein